MDKNHEFVDITPMIIDLGDKNKWYHPYINDYYSPDSDSEYNDNTYRIYLENKNGDNMYVYFKSQYLDHKVEAWSKTGDFSDEDESKWPDNSILFKKPYVDSQTVYDCLFMTLAEDVWSPQHPNGGWPMRTSPEFRKWRTEANHAKTSQFCFSKFGRKVGRFFNHDWKVSFFSLDCDLTTDGKT